MNITDDLGSCDPQYKTEMTLVHEDLDNEHWVGVVRVFDHDERHVIQVQANADTLICMDMEFQLMPFKTYAWPKVGLVAYAMTIVALQYAEHNRNTIKEPEYFRIS